uniref:Secreted protein n=1 Tax=Rhizophora mucronata TaxID=61149 RepID=A0A2P2LW23_RHIMU
MYNQRSWYSHMILFVCSCPFCVTLPALSNITVKSMPHITPISRSKKKNKEKNFFVSGAYSPNMGYTST